MPCGKHVDRTLCPGRGMQTHTSFKQTKLGKRQQKNITLELNHPPHAICGDKEDEKGWYAMQASRTLVHKRRMECILFAFGFWGGVWQHKRVSCNQNLAKGSKNHDLGTAQPPFPIWYETECDKGYNARQPDSIEYYSPIRWVPRSCRNGLPFHGGGVWSKNSKIGHQKTELQGVKNTTKNKCFLTPS